MENKLQNKLQIETVNISELKPAEYNPRKNNKRQQEVLKRSLLKFGVVEPIIINRNPERYNVIIGGHFRVQELIKLKQKTVEAVIVNLSREEEKELNIRLNSNTGSWDYDLMFKNFSIGELKEIDFDFNVMEKEASDLIEKYNIIYESDKEPKQKVREFIRDNKRNIKQGDIYILHNPKNNLTHRLMCGDSLKQENIKKLLQNKKADMIFTDPPYNQNIQIAFSSNKKETIIANDNLNKEEYNKFLDDMLKIIEENTEKNAHIYICGNRFNDIAVRTKADKLYGKEKSIIFYWIKDIIGLGYNYRSQYENIFFYTHQESIKFYDKTESNVWEAPKISSINFRKQEKDNLPQDTSTTQIHPTIKPTSLIARAIKNSAIDPNYTVLDLFGGSGSTLIACERMERKCRIIELDEYFCNIIIDRWEKLTGEKAIKEEDKKK